MSFKGFYYTSITDTCKGIIKNLGVEKFCPNSKFPDKRMYGLTRFDCIDIFWVFQVKVIKVNVNVIFRKNEKFYFYKFIFDPSRGVRKKTGETKV